jgi:hypothetical protein
MSSVKQVSTHSKSTLDAGACEIGLFPHCGLHFRVRVTKEDCAFCKRHKQVPAENSTQSQSKMT